MKLKIFLAITITTILLLTSCNEQGTNPTEQLKDPREMTWVADTINNPIPNTYQTLMSSMYASSSSNVYLGGHTDSRAQIWHYDGATWKYIDNVDQLGPYNVIGIKGISENSIWVYGYLAYSIIGGNLKKPCVLKFNGNNWVLHALDGYGRIIKVGGESENNIWAVGDSGIVFNYNGTTWKKDYVKVYAATGASYFLNSVAVINNTTHLIGAVFDVNKRRNVFYFIKGNIGNWSIIDSMYLENPSSQVKFGNRGLYLSKEGELFSHGDLGVWKYNGTSWDHIINTSYSFISVFSLKSNYTIAVGEFGNVYFYDGTTWTKLERFFTADGAQNMNDVWTDGKEVILLGNLVDKWPMKTVVYKGK